MKYWKGSAVAALMALLLCCGGATGDEQAVETLSETGVGAEEAIAAAGEKLLEAYLARDLERWLAGFTDDVVVMPPGAVMLAGKEALSEAGRIQFSRLEEYEVEIESELLETLVAGEWAYTRDIFEVRYRPLDGSEPILERGRSLIIWKRQSDGNWLVSRHMLNRPTPGLD